MTEPELTRLIDETDARLRDAADAEHARTGESRHALAAQLGRELILLGTSYVGTALGLGDPAGPLLEAKRLIGRLKVMARTPRN